MDRDIFHLRYDVKMLAGQHDTAEIMLWGEVVSDGPKWWKWSEEDKSAADFDKAVKQVKADGATKVLLRINSPGGVCTEAVAMRSVLANAGFEEINIRIEGLCASAATDIATLPGAHVAISEGSEYMIHNPMGGIAGTADDMERTAKRLRNIEQMSRSFYVKKTGKTEEEVKAWMDAETWFTAEEAVEYGFCDELLEAKAKDETMPAVACADSKSLATMRALYRNTPTQVTERQEEPPKAEEPQAAPTAEAMVVTAQEVSNVAPVAGAASEINTEEETEMDLDFTNLTPEQLQEGAPALMEQIRQSAIAAERQRQDDIDALTMPGYEQMATQAKQQGTSALDFQKQMVAAMRQKGPAFVEQRQKETAPAQSVPAAAADRGGLTEEQEIQQNAKEIAEIAKQLYGNSESMY